MELHCNDQAFIAITQESSASFEQVQQIAQVEEIINDALVSIEFVEG